MDKLTRKRLDCLSRLLDHAEQDGDADSAAALRWAIFTLERGRGDCMLSEKIKQYRLENGLTQKELAEALKSSQNTISNYETGVRTPTVKKLAAISALFGCSVADLMEDRGADPETSRSSPAIPGQVLGEYVQGKAMSAEGRVPIPPKGGPTPAACPAP